MLWWLDSQHLLILVRLFFSFFSPPSGMFVCLVTSHGSRNVFGSEKVDLLAQRAFIFVKVLFLSAFLCATFDSCEKHLN